MRRNESGRYKTPSGEFLSVTNYLGYYDKGHLKPWYAKRAALDCVAQVELFQEGKIDLDECLARILDWPTRMRAAEVYRDHKGRIGSLAHHALYHHALGLGWKGLGEMRDWLIFEGKKLGLLLDEEGRLAPDNDYRRLADAAAPYAMQAISWCAKYRPEWDMVGAEAMVVSDRYEYAGTMDSIAWLSTATTSAENSATAAGLRMLGEQLGKDRVRVQIDFKTSNSLQDTYQLQTEAYANADYIVMVDDEGQARHPIGDLDAIGILHVGTEDAQLHIYPRSDAAFEAFLGLKSCVDFLLNPDKPLKAPRAAAKQPAAPVKTTVRSAPF